MQVAVFHEELSEAEQECYVRQVTDRFPISIVEKIIMVISFTQPGTSWN